MPYAGRSAACLIKSLGPRAGNRRVQAPKIDPANCFAERLGLVDVQGLAGKMDGRTIGMPQRASTSGHIRARVKLCSGLLGLPIVVPAATHRMSVVTLVNLSFMVCGVPQWSSKCPTYGWSDHVTFPFAWYVTGTYQYLQWSDCECSTRSAIAEIRS